MTGVTTEAGAAGPAPLRVGVLGTGALGYHHVRLLAALPEAELVGVFDASPAAAERVREDHGARVFERLEDLAGAVDAAVVAVPTVFHAEVAGPLLERGIHVLVEKPMASSLAEADRLIAAAERSGAVLGVGHVEFYNPAVQALLAAGGTPRFVEIERLARFTPRSLDVDVVLDLMIHDLQILHALDDSPLGEIRATGIDVLSPRVDIANARIELASGCVASVTASRVSAERVRKLRIFREHRYHSLDYQAQEIKGFRLEAAEESGGERRIVADDLPVTAAEPLRRELQAFLARCRGEQVPFADGASGRRALATALAIAAKIGR
ncbi:MAG TPA: Gfo/Idh/MocA family oxidoreductase [Thermoanaerobaculia bacterium]|nr:Gfo/Idh/MocA family oxidoreductase [Thermoanaerobaculia bacterium]